MLIAGAEAAPAWPIDLTELSAMTVEGVPSMPASLMDPCQV